MQCPRVARAGAGWAGEAGAGEAHGRRPRADHLVLLLEPLLQVPDLPLEDDILLLKLDDLVVLGRDLLVYRIATTAIALRVTFKCSTLQ